MALMAATQTNAQEWAPRNFKNERPSPLKPNEIANAVLEGDKVLNYRQLLKHPKLGDQWQLSSANEFGRLAQGIGGRIRGTDTIHFIKKSDVPQDRMRDVTYGKFVCNVRPEKEEKN